MTDLSPERRAELRQIAAMPELDGAFFTFKPEETIRVLDALEASERRLVSLQESIRDVMEECECGEQLYGPCFRCKTLRRLLDRSEATP